MSCCRPEYREVVKEQEEKINQKGKDSLPLLAKVFLGVITIGAIAVLVFLL